jgi:putative Mg2+ transporter-C (MgtC) family protein
LNSAIFDLNQFGILVRISLAMLLGAIIGFERELADKPAGLRTHMLVSGAAALLVALGGILMEFFTQQTGDRLVQSDPVRIIEAVITGVSFLGAGTIIRNREEGDVSGLTTAASLLFAASVGIGVAMAQWVLAIGSTVLVLLTLRVLPVFESRILRKK